MSRNFRVHGLAVTFACACLTAGALSPARAAEPAAEFAVTAAQMQALGVTVRKLVKPAGIDGLPVPARVVLSPGQDVVVGAPVDGVIDRLLVGPQDAVKSGRPLLRIVSPEFVAMQLRLMEASSRARLSRQTLDREKQLFADGIIAERRVQEAQAAEQTDAAAVRQAEVQLRLVGADPAVIRNAAAGGKLEDGFELRARTDGLITALDAKPGQRVKDADPLVRIADLRQLWLDIQVPVDAASARAGEIAIVGRDAVAAAQSVGAVVGDSQTVTLRARVTRGAEKLRLGEVVQVRVPFAAAEGWALPLQSVTRQDDRAVVFVRSAKGLVATSVRVLASAGQSVQVQGALEAGDEVAVSSVIALKAAWLGKGGGE
jgi:RND family efflux transporter MFP subunit